MFEIGGKQIAASLAKIVAPKHCVGSRNRELHELALKLMEQTHFDIATAGEIADIWRGK